MFCPYPRNVHIGVAGQADQHRTAAVRRDMQDQDGVRAVPGVGSGVQLALLRPGQARPAVRAGDEPVLPGARRRAARVVHQHVAPDKLGVQVEVHCAEQDQDHQHDAAGDEQDPPSPVPPRPAAAPAATGGRLRRPRVGGRGPAALAAGWRAVHRRLLRPGAGLLAAPTGRPGIAARGRGRPGAARGQAHGRLARPRRRRAGPVGATGGLGLLVTEPARWPLVHAVPSHQIVTTSLPDDPRSPGCPELIPSSSSAASTSPARSGGRHSRRLVTSTSSAIDR